MIKLVNSICKMASILYFSASNIKKLSLLPLMKANVSLVMLSRKSHIGVGANLYLTALSNASKRIENITNKDANSLNKRNSRRLLIW